MNHTTSPGTEQFGSRSNPDTTLAIFTTILRDRENLFHFMGEFKVTVGSGPRI
jgi:hypothetical protein